jgi:hypothetical protein
MVRHLVNPILARFGHNYDSWMAMTGPRATAAQLALARALTPKVSRLVKVRLAAQQGTPLR